jgi:hypothetical protein
LIVTCFTTILLGVENQMGQTSRVDIAKDGDADIDICTKPWNGTLHFYPRNMLVEDSKAQGE